MIVWNVWIVLLCQIVFAFIEPGRKFVFRFAPIQEMSPHNLESYSFLNCKQ
jgi:hypothetical protein